MDFCNTKEVKVGNASVKINYLGILLTHISLTLIMTDLLRQHRGIGQKTKSSNKREKTLGHQTELVPYKVEV